MKSQAIKEILMNAKKLSETKTEEELLEMIGAQMQLEKLISKVQLALFIMRDNGWDLEESEIEYQIYRILEKAVNESV